ncbi:hypothetical protein [Paraburkholderia elongata]|uniref:Transmembrane protein n=1 Tax=Paraburkholderia elongata TaxID=2675747 RepID=A0A972ST10_9BURK|nr:hypothetical protein [Paraburkholderia elongata]NPT62460.1 hypothetical protein [Paraburkholderia elongata]
MSESTGSDVHEESNNWEKVMGRVRAQTPEELHSLRSRMFGAYTAFVAAALLASITNSGVIGGGRLVVSLLALSLPALVAQLLLDRTVTVIQRRKVSLYRGLARWIGFVPSIAAFTLLVGHVSVVGAVFFALGCFYWFFVVDVVTAAGAKSEDSTV